MAMTVALSETLSMLARAAQDAEDDWWLIGSAAVVLHGGQVLHVKDVDLMMSVRDADAFLHRVGGDRGAVEPSERFQSDVFGVWNEPPVPIEIFGGFRLAIEGVWQDVSFATREPVAVANARVFVPSATELVRLLHSFGRAKDLERAARLAQLEGGASKPA
jgi:hypothetical protein